ncbi:hypothetical protein [Nocardia otitidiscaviarum]|uniref:hypothetical protein n=1 Tax=Nocardia otitidiscaviarum TaxID=1823 RepID=UPI001892DB5C|nr:hypothetical protein [Nocardia otitidiscaviarum]MBF6179905.1 hypothetical protein [Nocardia otitidiscaviarum]
MSRDVWMTVSSPNSFRDDELKTKYYDNIGKITVDVGSGALLMSPEVAEELFGQLREAINDARLVAAERSGESAHLISGYREYKTVASEDAADYRQRLAEARRKAVA